MQNLTRNVKSTKKKRAPEDTTWSQSRLRITAFQPLQALLDELLDNFILHRLSSISILSDVFQDLPWKSWSAIGFVRPRSRVIYDSVKVSK